MNPGRAALFLTVLAASTSLAAAEAPALASDRDGPRRAEGRPPFVSLISLVATPERFDSRRVIVKGFLTLEFEGTYLCPRGEPVSEKDCIWVDMEHGFDEKYARKIAPEQWRACNGKFVLVDAVYDQHNNGHMGQFSGSLTRISRVSGQGCKLDSTGNDS